MNKICRQVQAIQIITLLLVTILSAAQSAENRNNGEVAFGIKLGLLDQTGTEQSSYGLSANFTKKIGEETLLITESDDKEIVLQWSPGISYDVSKTELESEEKKTKTLAFKISSFTWKITEDLSQYLSISYGREEIEVTDNIGDTSENGNSVYIWNVGLKHNINSKISFKFDYKLSQEEIFSEKTQHVGQVSLEFEF